MTHVAMLPCGQLRRNRDNLPDLLTFASSNKVEHCVHGNDPGVAGWDMRVRLETRETQTENEKRKRTERSNRDRVKGGGQRKGMYFLSQHNRMRCSSRSRCQRKKLERPVAENFSLQVAVSSDGRQRLKNKTKHKQQQEVLEYHGLQGCPLL